MDNDGELYEKIWDDLFKFYPIGDKSINNLSLWRDVGMLMHTDDLISYLRHLRYCDKTGHGDLYMLSKELKTRTLRRDQRLEVLVLLATY